MTTKQLSISEFKTHCTEEIRALEKGGIILELTRHGKRVASVQAVSAGTTPPNLAGWIGSGKGSVSYGPDYDPAGPAWDAKDWEA